MNSVPIGLVRGMAAAIPRLSAEEYLVQIDMATMGNSARFDLKDIHSHQRNLRRLASGDDGRAERRRKRGAPPSPEALAAMGIGVVLVPVEAAGQQAGSQEVGAHG